MSAASRTVDPALVENLELQLRSSLRPVHPNPEFVSHLHTRLTTAPGMTVEHHATALSMLLVALSLLTGVFLVWWMRRIRSMIAS